MNFHRVLFVPIISILILFPVLLAGAADKEGFQFKKQPELQQIKPKKPVRIKLKRTAKDDYSWELTGDDVDDIIRTDKKLRQMMGQK